MAEPIDDTIQDDILEPETESELNDGKVADNDEE